MIFLYYLVGYSDIHLRVSVKPYDIETNYFAFNGYGVCCTLEGPNYMLHMKPRISNLNHISNL